LIKIVKSLENGKDRITGVLFPGELFGLESLTDPSYPLTAVALRDSRRPAKTSPPTCESIRRLLSAWCAFWWGN
jgi:hypothetical protein